METTEDHLDFAVAGLSLSGHEVTDPVLLGLLQQTADSIITLEEALDRGCAIIDTTEREEQFATSARLIHLGRSPVEPGFDATHLGRIHHRLFEHLQPGAGQVREDPAIEDWFRRLGLDDALRGLGRAEFTDRLASSWGGLARLQPFRDGNVRAQFVFFHQLTEQAGFVFDHRRFGPGSMTLTGFTAAPADARQTGEPAPLAGVLRRVVR